jgi:hypothetical protein
MWIKGDMRERILTSGGEYQPISSQLPAFESVVVFFATLNRRARKKPFLDGGHETTSWSVLSSKETLSGRRLPR